MVLNGLVKFRHKSNWESVMRFKSLCLQILSIPCDRVWVILLIEKSQSLYVNKMYNPSSLQMYLEQTVTGHIFIYTCIFYKVHLYPEIIHSPHFVMLQSYSKLIVSQNLTHKYPIMTMWNFSWVSCKCIEIRKTKKSHLHNYQQFQPPVFLICCHKLSSPVFMLFVLHSSSEAVSGVMETSMKPSPSLTLYTLDFFKILS